MRTFLLASAAAFSVMSGAAFAQTADQTARPGRVAGVGVSEPTSTRASNIDASDTRSTIAPTLPSPREGADAGPRAFLRTASQALQANRTGEAQEALERAESRALDRSTDPAAASAPDTRPMIQQIATAREALGHGDVAGARRAIDMALNDSGTVPSAVPAATTASAMPAPRPGASTITVPVGGGVGSDAIGSGGFVGPRGSVDAPGVPGQGTIPGTSKPMDELNTVEDRGEASGNGTNQ